MAEKLYDAVIVGTGASGGWAAKDLTAQGMEVLVLDAGPMPEPSRDFVHHGAHPPDDPRRGLRMGRQRGALRESTNGRLPLAFTESPDHPFTTPAGKPFRWMRSRIVGGRTLHWGRASHRLSDLDFKAASRDGYGDNWPISHADLAPYYDRVEEHIGVSAYAEGYPQLPDGKFQPGMPYNCAERIFVTSVRRMGLPATHRRIAQLSRPLLGRPACHFCGACGQGCDIGAMFNSVVSTLPPAQATGRMTLRPDSIVRTVLMGDDGKATGVSYIDRLTRQDYEARGKVVILAASCLENSRILLNSAPGGIGNSSGVLGRYIMDQFSGGGVTGFLPQLRGQQPRNTDGKSSGMFIPVFRNIKERHPKFIRGYCMSATGGQTEFPRYALSTPGYGKDFKTHVRDYSMAQARVWLSAGEMLPRYENRVEIDPEVKDAWGIPVLKITCTFSDNEHAMFADASEMMKEVLVKAGGEILSSGGNISIPGGLYHEVGGCRMGSDPKTSVLDPFCRMHDVRNVYVFSGSPFVTTGPHHPTLTMMALTARGCSHLSDQFKQGNV